MTVAYAKTAPTISASHHTSTHNKKNQTSLLVKFYTYAIPALLARIWYTNLTLSRQRHRHSFHFYFSILPKNDFLAILIRLVVLEHSICVELWLAENGPRVMYAELNQSE